MTVRFAKGVRAGNKRRLRVRKRKLFDHFENQGLPYTVARLDSETVLYRHMGNYDVEISDGAGRNPFVAYVWRLKDGWHPIGFADRYEVPSKDIASAATEIHRIAEEYIRRPAHELH